MMKVNQMLATGGLAVVLCFGVTSVLAQNAPPAGGNQGGDQGGGRGRGNFDMAQFQQRMMERNKEQLEITDDAEWKVIQPLVQKVMDARMASFSGMGRGMFGRRGGPGGGGDNNSSRPATASQNPEADALQKAIDAKASNADMKAALAKFAAARKVKQAELEKAQDALRKVLSVRQEAIASMNGLL